MRRIDPSQLTDADARALAAALNALLGGKPVETTRTDRLVESYRRQLGRPITNHIRHKAAA